MRLYNICEYLRWYTHFLLRNLQKVSFYGTRAHCVQIHFSVSLYCMAKAFSIHIWRTHLFHQNFITNSLVLSNPLLFASGDCNLTIFLEFWQKYRNIRKSKMDDLSNHSLQRQKAVDLKEPVNLWENFNGISISFISVQRVLWLSNFHVKRRS